MSDEFFDFFLVMFVGLSAIGIIGMVSIFSYVVNCIRRQRLEEKRLDKLEKETCDAECAADQKRAS